MAVLVSAKEDMQHVQQLHTDLQMIVVTESRAVILIVNVFFMGKYHLFWPGSGYFLHSPFVSI